MSLRVDFPDYLTLTDHAFVPGYEDFDVSVDRHGAFITIISPNDNITRDGRILTLYFDVCPNMDTNQQLPVTVTFKNAETGYELPRNANRQDLDIGIVPGEIRVQPMTTLGDTAVDGRVTSFSAMWLARYLIGHPAEIDLRAADVNCDGYVNMEDLTHLLGALVGRHRLGCPPGCVHHN
jgi:hypothetical protein